MTSSRTAIYARYSSANQHDGTSIEQQLEACATLAGAGAVPYIDRGISGTTLDRPAFQQMLADANAGKLGLIVVHRYDRLGRDAADGLTVLRQLTRLGVKVVSAAEGDDEFARGIHLMIGEQYSRVLSERAARGQRLRFEAGLWPGGRVPLGYRLAHGRLEVVAAEADQVRAIFAEYLSRSVGTDAMARRMNQKGLRTKAGKLWTGGAIRTILTAPYYDGRQRFGVEASPYQKRTGRRPLKAASERRDESIRIIPADQYAAVQAKLADRSKFRTPASKVRLLTGLIRCGVCDATLVANGGGNHGYWQCYRRRHHGDAACSNRATIFGDAVARAIAATAADLLDGGLLDEAVALAAERLTTGRPDRADTEARIAELRRRIAAGAERLLDPELPRGAKAAVGRAMQQAEEEADALAATLDDAPLLDVGRLRRAATLAAEEVVGGDWKDAETAHTLAARWLGRCIWTADRRLIPDGRVDTKGGITHYTTMLRPLVLARLAA